MRSRRWVIDTYTRKRFYFDLVDFDDEGRPWPYRYSDGMNLHPDRLTDKARTHLVDARYEAYVR